MNELENNTLHDLSIHFENCEKCKNKYIALQEKTALVNAELSLLKPKVIPHKPFVLPAVTNKHRFRNIINSIIYAIRSLGYKKALTVPVLSICLILLFVLNKKPQPDFRELSQQIAAIEQSFIADSKQAMNENCFFVTYFDEETKQIEIIQKKCDTGVIISRNIIKLR